MKRLASFLAVLSGLIFASLLNAPSAFADNVGAANLQIKPTSNAFTLSESSTEAYSLAITNNGSEAVSYRLYAVPYTVDTFNENYTPIFTRETSRSQMYRWVTFRTAAGDFAAEAVYEIQPGEEQIIGYRINIPAEIPAGGQYAAIFAETITSTTITSDAGIKTISRVTLLLYGHGSGDTIESAELTDYHLTGFLSAGNISGNVKAINSGNTDFDALCTFEVKTIFGKTLYSLDYNYPILPETERRIVTEWADTPLFGIFKVTFDVSALSESISHTRFVLIMPVFVMIIMLLLLTALAIWIIILFRKRKERSSRLVI